MKYLKTYNQLNELHQDTLISAAKKSFDRGDMARGMGFINDNGLFKMYIDIILFKLERNKDYLLEAELMNGYIDNEFVEEFGEKKLRASDLTAKSMKFLSDEFLRMMEMFKEEGIEPGLEAFEYIIDYATGTYNNSYDLSEDELYKLSELVSEFRYDFHLDPNSDFKKINIFRE